MWCRCRCDIRAWWSPKRPSSAMEKVGILDRIVPVARSSRIFPRKERREEALDSCVLLRQGIHSFEPIRAILALRSSAISRK
jgi:hypothetical protein